MRSVTINILLFVCSFTAACAETHLPAVSKASNVSLYWYDINRLKLNFDCASSLPMKNVDKLIITPLFVNDEDSVVKYPSVIYLSKSERRFLKRRMVMNSDSVSENTHLLCSGSSEGVFRYSESLAMTGKLQRGRLVISYKYADCCHIVTLANDTLSVPPVRFGKKVVPIGSSNVSCFPLVCKPERRIKIPLYFQFDNDRVDENLGDNHLLISRMDSLFMPVIADKENYDIKAVVVNGFASPEGSPDYNFNLSQRRAESFSSYLKDKYSLHEIPFAVSSHGGNWQGLYELIAKDTVFSRSSYLKDMIGSIAGKRQKPKDIRYETDNSIFEYMKENYFSSLRFIDVELIYESKVDDSVKQTVGDDMLYINNSSKALLEYDLDKAWQYLKGMKNDCRAWNNIGIYYWMNDKLDEAEAYFKKAVETGSKEAAINLKRLKE